MLKWHFKVIFHIIRHTCSATSDIPSKPALFPKQFRRMFLITGVRLTVNQLFLG